MKTEGAVKVEKDNKGSQQWGLGKFFYRQEGAKNRLDTKRIKSLSYILFIAMSCALLFKETPQSEKVDSEIQSPKQERVESITEIPVFREKNLEELYNKSQKKKITRFSKLQVITRSKNVDIPPGSMIRAQLISGASNGPVKAKALENLEIDGEVFVEEEMIFFGSGFSTEERLLVRFTKLIDRSGKSFQINAQALDAGDQVAGLKGSKISRFAKGLAVGAGLNFITGFTEGLQEQDVKDGVAIKKSNLKNAALNGLTHASLEQSKSYMESLKDQQTIITVKPGTEILVMFNGEY